MLHYHAREVSWERSAWECTWVEVIYSHLCLVATAKSRNKPNSIKLSIYEVFDSDAISHRRHSAYRPWHHSNQPPIVREVIDKCGMTPSRSSPEGLWEVFRSRWPSTRFTAYLHMRVTFRIKLNSYYLYCDSVNLIMHCPGQGRLAIYYKPTRGI